MHAVHLCALFDRPLSVQLWGTLAIAFAAGREKPQVAAAIAGFRNAWSAVPAPLTRFVSEEAVASSTRFATVLLVLGVCLAAVVATAVLRRATRAITLISQQLEHFASAGMTSLQHATEALAAGRLDVEAHVDAPPLRVEGRDELGMLSRSLESAMSRAQAAVASYGQAVSTLRAMLTETQTVVSAAQRGESSIRADAAPFAGAYHSLLSGFNEAQDASHRPVATALSVLEQVAQHNLSVSVSGEFPGDHARLARAINVAIGNVAKALHEVEVSAEQITAAVQEQSSLTARTVSRLDDARTLARETRDRLREGTQEMHSLGNAMERMTSSAERTASIVKTIDEVRQLAIRAAGAARQTADLIDETVTTARESRTITQSVQERLARVDGDVERVTRVVEHVADDCHEQRHQIEEVSRGVSAVSDQTQRAAANAEEAASASEELNSQAASMRTLVHRFVVTDSRGEPRNMARRQLHRPATRPYMERRAS